MLIDLGHGANVEVMATKYGKNPKELIDFSSNINPYKLEGLSDYIAEGLSKSSNYPDISYTQLRNNIAGYLKCNPDFIIPGNGATEIMYLLMRCLSGPIAILNPTFSEYERSARLSGIQVVDLYLEKHNTFSLSIETLKDQLTTFESLLICNPNNPTGRVQDIEEILELMATHQKKLIVDETFIEFVKDEEKYSLLKFVKDYPNLIIIKAATKFFGLPGIRLGYGITSDKALLEEMYFYKEPWTVNCFAEVLSAYIFKDQNYIQTTKNYFQKERQRLLEELSKISYLKAYPTDANFILIELRSLHANQLKESLLKEHNLLIRDASNFKGLNEHFIRIAIRTPQENDLLIEKLKGGLYEKVIDCRNQ